MSQLIRSAVTALVASLALFFLLRLEPVSRTLLISFATASVPALMVSHALHRAVLRRWKVRTPHRVLLLGNGAERWVEAVGRHPEWGLQIVVLNSPDQLPATLVQRAIDEVYITDPTPDPELLSQAASLCEELGISLSIDANFLGIGTSQAEVHDYDGWALLTFRPTRSTTEMALKRALDITVAVMGIALVFPVAAVIALAIRMHDGGPVMFIQERCGLQGRTFRMYKFRTMVPDALQRLERLRHLNEATGPIFKLRQDPRITRLGRLLRRTSLDEIPQLLNVLRGDMSLVGPRPPLPEEVVKYERWQLRRLSVRPGMTGISQVSGRSDLGFERWMALDLDYVDNWTLRRDLMVLIRTVPAVLAGRGAR